MDVRRKPFGFGTSLFPAQFDLLQEQVGVEVYCALDLRLCFGSMFYANLYP
jgi:hypothetical protein